MNKYLFTVTLLLLNITTVLAQKYFNFYYGNVPEDANGYYVSMANAEGWLYSGQYNTCTTCSRLSDNGKIKAADIDSLHKSYMLIYPSGALSNTTVPVHTVNYANRKTTKPPYIIHTLYQIKKNVPVPIYQIKVVFSSDQHNDLNDVEDISFHSGDGIKHFDKKLLLQLYKKQLEEDAKNPPPEVELN